MRNDGRVEHLHGSGAGRWPTAEAVLGDLWQLVREGRSAGRLRARPEQAPVRIPSSAAI
jgi:hypothetical protein